MPRPRSSSLQRAVRFNGILLNGNSLEDVDLTEEGMESEVDAPSQDDDEDTVRHTNTEYIEFRKIIQTSSSTRKMGNNGCSRASKTKALDKSVADRRRKSSSLSAKDLMIITNAASGASGSKPSPTSKRKTSIESESAGERDDEPTSRQGDEGQSIERSQETPTSNSEAHFTFAIPDGDEHDVRVVCKRDPLITDDETPLSVASTFDLKAGQHMPMPVLSTDVIIAIEASSISALDCVVRRGFDGRAAIMSDYTPGCDIIGTVVKCGQEAFLSGISEGERVACITRCGGNARYIRLPADSLIKARDDIDPSEASGAMLPYFMAHQILQSGVSPPLRYKVSLKGKHILVAENTGIVGLAIASLCKLSSAKKTFIVSPPEYHDQIKSLGAIPLNKNIDDWARKIKEKVDILVDAGKVSGKAQQQFLKTSGRLVRLALPPVPPPPESKPSLVPAPIRNFCSVAHIAFTANASRAALYDVFYSIEKNPTLYKSDLAYIFNLLALRRIRPKIDKFVLLSDVGECHQELENFHQEGAIVCEPWRRGGIDNMIYQT